MAVAVDGDYAVVADVYRYDDIPDRSSAYVFAIAGDCNENASPDICDILDETSEDINGDGVPDECEVLPGDMNCDGVVDTGDIPSFVLALIDPQAYTEAYPECDITLADINGDGSAHGDDIRPFVERLLAS